MVHIALMALFLIGVDIPMAAAAPHLIVLVEEPYVDPNEPPSRAQRETALELVDALTRRVLQLSIQEHMVESGAKLIERGDAAAVNNADLVFQLLIQVSERGFRYQAQLYSRQRQEWIPIDSRLLKTTSAETLASMIADDALPALVVHAHEISRAGGRPILFADCVFPPSLNATSMEQLAESASLRYAGKLSGEAALLSRFGVIRLVPPIQTDYQWWCVHLQRPRLGLLRPDTITVHGSIEQLSQGRPEVLIVISNRERIVPSRETIPLDPQDWPAFLKRVAETVEGLTHEM